MNRQCRQRLRNAFMARRTPLLGKGNNILGASNRYPLGSQVCSRVALARVQDAHNATVWRTLTRAKATRLHTCPGSGSTPGCVKYVIALGKGGVDAPTKEPSVHSC